MLHHFLNKMINTNALHNNGNDSPIVKGSELNARIQRGGGGAGGNHKAVDYFIFRNTGMDPQVTPTKFAKLNNPTSTQCRAIIGSSLAGQWWSTWLSGVSLEKNLTPSPLC